jgi:archaellum component FlaC
MAETVDGMEINVSAAYIRTCCLGHELQDTRAERDRLRATVDEQLPQLRETLVSLKGEMETLRKDAQALMDRNQELSAMNVRQRQTIRSNHRWIAELQDRLNDLSVKHHNLSVKHANQRDTIGRQIALIRARDEQIADLEKRLTLATSDPGAEIGRLHDTINKWAAYCRTQDDRIREQDDLLASQHALLMKQDAMIGQPPESARDKARIADLEDDVQRLKDDLDGAHDENERLDRAWRGLANTIERLNREKRRKDELFGHERQLRLEADAKVRNLEAALASAQNQPNVTVNLTANGPVELVERPKVPLEALAPGHKLGSPDSPFTRGVCTMCMLKWPCPAVHAAAMERFHERIHRQYKKEKAEIEQLIGRGGGL